MQSPRPAEWKSALQSNQGTLWAVLAFVSLGVGVAVLLGMSEKPAKKSRGHCLQGARVSSDLDIKAIVSEFCL